MSEDKEKEFIELREIANKLGTTIDQLLSTGKTPAMIIESYKENKLQILND